MEKSRPKNPGPGYLEEESQQVTVRMPLSLLKKIDAKAEKLHKHRADIIRGILRRVLR